MQGDGQQGAREEAHAEIRWQLGCGGQQAADSGASRQLQVVHQALQPRLPRLHICHQVSAILQGALPLALHQGPQLL